MSVAALAWKGDVDGVVHGVSMRIKERMAKQDLIECKGHVTKVSTGGLYTIKLDNDIEILAKLCGKMRRYSIRVVLGDRVTVGLSPYDLTRGLILYRYR